MRIYILVGFRSRAKEQTDERRWTASRYPSLNLIHGGSRSRDSNFSIKSGHVSPYLIDECTSERQNEIMRKKDRQEFIAFQKKMLSGIIDLTRIKRYVTQKICSNIFGKVHNIVNSF